MSDPSYLINRMPTALRRALSQRAAADDLSLADTMRSILCTHYGLDCPPRGQGYSASRDDGSEQMVLRVSPELFECIKADAAESGETMRTIILDLLEAELDPRSEGAAA